MKKKMLLLAVLTLIISCGLFAYEGFFRGTFSPQMIFVIDDDDSPHFSMGLDLDLVHKTGITFGTFQGAIWPKDSRMIPVLSFGFGYTFAAYKWCIGAKLIAVTTLDTGGFNLNGTFWLIDSLGISANMDALIFGDAKIIMARAGLSIRI